MKRSDIKRKTPLKRTTMTRRPKAKARSVVAAQTAFMSERLRCAVCWIRADRAYGPDRRIVLHHLAGRGRNHEVEGNWCAVCSRCHSQYHDGGQFGDDGERLPALTPGHMLWAKEQSDGVDLGLIASLKGWAGLPDHWIPCELPGAFLRERERN